MGTKYSLGVAREAHVGKKYSLGVAQEGHLGTKYSLGVAQEVHVGKNCGVVQVAMLFSVTHPSLFRDEQLH